MTGKKRIVLRITAVIITVLVVLTFASRTIYGLSLPVVHVIEPQFDTVPVTARTTGFLESEAMVDVTAEDDWLISEVLVKNGDMVRNGDVLFTISTKEYEDYEKQLENQIRDLEIGEKAGELNIMRIENRITDIPAADLRNNASTRRYRAELVAELELMQIQLELLQTRLTQVRTELEEFSYLDGGAIIANETGMILNLTVKERDRPVFGEKLLSILPDNSVLTVNFKLDAREGVEFDIDVPVTVTFFTQIGTQPKEQKHDTVVSSRRLSDDGQSWEYKAFIDEYEGSPLMSIKTDITIGHLGIFYGLVVPVAAVSEGRYGPRVFVIQSKPGLFGEEFFVMEANVTVQASNNFVAAIDLPGGYHYEMVTYTSRPIMDGDIVRVEGR